MFENIHRRPCVCSSCVDPSPSLTSHTVTTSSFVHCNNMPALEDWKIVPLSYIDRIHHEHRDRDWKTAIREFFETKFLQTDFDDSEISSLNSAKNHELIDGQIVRFRCMIQDMFDPEFYVERLIEGTKSKCGRYRDFISGGNNEDLESVVNGERHGFYCVNIPVECDWVRTGFERIEGRVGNPIPSGSVCTRLKRSHEDEQQQQQMEVDNQPQGNCVKKPKTTISNHVEKGSEDRYRLNIPVSNDPGAKAAIVKLYDYEDGTFSLNDLVEFYGILSIDPSLEAPARDSDPFHPFSEQERSARYPPPSLVPRLHVLQYKKLTHSNPLLPKTLTFFPSCPQVRSELLSIFRNLLMGDGLAAEYLLCHLVSKVYSRASEDVQCLGKFSLNLHNVPLHSRFSQRLAEFLKLLLCKALYVPMTIRDLNSLIFVPKKNYDANRLDSGLLQLSEGTHLTLDETKLQVGQLSSHGLRNVTALGNLITWQKVDYDFNYYDMKFKADIPCLVLSEGRSMLPSDVQIRLEPTIVPSPSVIDERFAEVDSELKDISVINNFRMYLTSVRLSSYELSEDIQNSIQDDFVSERRHSSITVDDLNQRLVLARLVTLTMGSSSLTSEVWNKVKVMEAERKQRISNSPSSSRNATVLGDFNGCMEKESCSNRIYTHDAPRKDLFPRNYKLIRESGQVPISLFNLSLNLIAQNVDCLESLEGFPSDMGRLIWNRFLECGNRKANYRVFIQAYPSFILTSCDLSGRSKLITELDNTQLLNLLEKVTELDLANCRLGDDHELIQNLWQITNLSTLILSGNDLSRVGLRKVMLPRTTQLGYLDVSSNPSISMIDVKRYIVTKCDKFIVSAERAFQFESHMVNPNFPTISIKTRGWACPLFSKNESQKQERNEKAEKFYGKRVTCAPSLKFFYCRKNIKRKREESFKVQQDLVFNDDEDILKMYR